MKKLKFLLCAALAVTLASSVFVGCASSDSANKSVTDVIKSEYGTTEFNISFISEGSAPVDDVVYTAYSMPTLPTPERVGYIFGGWYFDEGFTVRYTEGCLYSYMCDVVLYAKWEKEEFTQNGTYDIEFSAEILEDTIKKKNGEDSVFKDFASAISQTETYIEKTDGDLLLKLQYDCGETVGFGYYEVFTVGVNYSMTGTDTKIAETIASDTETVKTIFLDLNNFDIAKSIYLNVNVYDDNVWQYTYTVEFNITRLIGFSKNYVDVSEGLEDGYYLVRTGYYTAANAESPMAQYDPVYAYIKAEGGNYTLIKPFTPYRGLLMSSATGTDDDLYKRATTFCTFWFGYRINIPEGAYDTKINKSDYEYLPEYYNASDYINLSYEYHADTGKSYTVIDLGNDLSSQYMLLGAPTGWMEMTDSGSATVMLKLDYAHIIRLNGVDDYTPLSGDSYSYGSEAVYYPGNLSDLNNSVDMTETIEKYGTNTEIIDFFYSVATSGEKQILSSKITITPDEGTANFNVTDSRYALATFNVNYNVYGYEAESGANLWADMITINTFGSTGLREKKQIIQGKSCTASESVNLASLFAEKTGEEYSDGVTAYEYSVENGKVNYKSGKKLSSLSLTFESTVAIKFIWSDGDGNNKTIVVQLAEYEEPQVTVSNYTADGYSLGDDVPIPYVTAKWMGTSYDYYGNFYDDEDSDRRIIDNTKVALFDVENGNTVSFFKGDSFTIDSGEVKIAFTVKNKFGEIYIYYLTYSSVNRNLEYSVADGDGNVYAEGTEGSSATVVEAEADYGVFVKSGEVGTYIDKDFCMDINGKDINLDFSACNVYTRDSLTVCRTEAEALKTIGDGYALLEFIYTDDGGNSFTLCGIYGITLNGRQDCSFVSDKQLFTGYTYDLPSVYVSDGKIKLGSCYVNVYKSEGGEYKLQRSVVDGQEFTLITAGQYRMVYSVYIRYDENGDKVFGSVSEQKSIHFCQDIEVCDGKGNVSITYVTDSDHPFADSVAYTTFEEDGETYYSYTCEYSLAGNIISLGSKYFKSSSDNLYAWLASRSYTVEDTGKLFFAGNVISDYIGSFRAKEVTLYSVWDEGLTITFTAVDENGDTIVVSEETTYRQTGNYRTACYPVYLDQVTEKLTVPEGYEFLGWTGGVFGDEIVTLDKRLSNTHYFMNVESHVCTVNAVFKKYHKVIYNVDYDYCSTSFDAETVYDGETISDVTAKMSLTCKVEGYGFKGWYIYGDENKTLIDLSTYKVTSDVRLVALFGPVEE